MTDRATPDPSDWDAADRDVALVRLGYEAFLPGQQEAIDALLSHHRLLLVAPTGGGKSLCYQLPAVILPGTTVVVSPLISLMLDQVHALERRGVAATYFASTVPGDEMSRRLRAAADGAYKLIYVAPERLGAGRFIDLLHSLDCPLIAVDEAHCISEWGHDFRPDYLALGPLITSLEVPRILACTATATPFVRDEIIARLQMPAGTPQMVHGFARPNLALRALEVKSASQRHVQVDGLLHETLGSADQPRGAAILYAGTRRATEEEALRLQTLGWHAEAYHAGMAGEQRDRTQRRFIDRRLPVVVATNAFGMGIDRADVRAVCHLSPPSSIEAYYQEVGRAGRDGEPAVGLLLISPRDLPLRRYLIESNRDGEGVDPAIVQHKWNLFLELVRWTEGGSCRHDAILRYFGDEEETLAGCGRCDVCLTLADNNASFDDEETRLIVRKALSGVARIHGRLGLTAAVKLLRGDKDPRLERWGLRETSTCGILAEHSTDWLQRLLRRLVTAGWVDFSGGDRPVVVLTANGRETMLGHRPIHILLPPVASPTASAGAGSPRSRSRSRRAAGSGPDPETATPEERALFEALRQFRSQQARERGVPAFVVASDRTLRDIAHRRPRDLDELQDCFGIGASKAAEYGQGLLETLGRAETEQDPEPDVPLD